MKTTVLLFGRLRDQWKTDAMHLELAEGTVAGAIWDQLCATAEEADGYRQGMKVAVNRRYVANDTVLQDGDELALIPPVAGG